MISPLLSHGAWRSVQQVLTLICAAALVPSMGLAQEGDAVFDPGYVHEVRFNTPYPALFDTLEAHYTEGSVFQGTYVPCTVAVDGVVMDSVGVKEKGISSNFLAGLDGSVKMPFKVNFSEYVGGQRYDGQRKLNLHNGYYDPSMMHEAIVYRVLRQSGMPASRTAYARVYLNDVYWGLYLLVEDVDKPFLDRHLGEHGGNMYKRQVSTYTTCFDWDPAQPEVPLSIFEQVLHDSGDTSYADLQTLLETINTPTTDFGAAMDPVMEMDGLLRLMAAGYLFQNEDDVLTNCNNFFLYHAHSDDRFHWLPWDFNATFSTHPRPLIPLTLSDRPLIDLTLTDTALRAAFLDHVCAMAGLITPANLFPFIDSTYALIRPHLEEDPHRLYGLTTFDSVMDVDVPFWVVSNYHYSRGLRPFITQCAATASAALVEQGHPCLNTLGFAANTAASPLRLVPNPAGESVRIVGGQWAGSAFTITDEQGRSVLQGAVQGDEGVLKLGGLAPGIYHLVLRDAERTRVLRLVEQ